MGYSVDWLVCLGECRDVVDDDGDDLFLCQNWNRAQRWSWQSVSGVVSRDDEAVAALSSVFVS